MDGVLFVMANEPGEVSILHADSAAVQSGPQLDMSGGLDGNERFVMPKTWWVVFGI